MALAAPGPLPLDDGGTYSPSEIQQKLWGMWREFFDVWVPQITHGEPYILVHNGDAIEGVHHHSVTQISSNIEDQLRMAEAVIGPEVAKAASYYHVRGTEAHVGASAQHEEMLAKRLGAVPNAAGQHAMWDLWMNLGGHRINFMHHIGVTGTSAYESTAVHKETVEAFVESGRWGDAPPEVLVRSHRHRYMEVRIASEKGYTSCVVTPGWQVRTPYTYKLTGRQSQPQIGGVAIRLGDEELHTRAKVWNIKRPQEVVV